MESNLRRVELNKWKFALDQRGFGFGGGWTSPFFDDSSWTDVSSCTCWETYESALFDYEGGAWFRARFMPERSSLTRYILHFDGVGGAAEVYLNGKFIGRNDNRYLPFELDGTHAMRKNGENVVAVHVDNSFLGEKHLPGGNIVEWVMYGGLTHRVWMEEQPLYHMDNILAEAEADGSLTVKISLINRGVTYVYDGELLMEVEGLPECTCRVAAHCDSKTPDADGSAVYTMKVKAKKPALWSPDSPNLYTLKVTMLMDGKVVETQTERIGFRTIAVDGTKILLNGKEILIKGANRYDEYAPYGICPPEEKIREDLMHMKECGMNLVRTHYPQDPIHYRIADEIGIMYMIEVPLNWWNPKEGDSLLNHLGLAAEAADALERTFRWHANHPSWIIWSVGNECSHSHPVCQQVFRLLAERMRALHCRRLITYAANKPLLNSEEMDFCDILACNIYSGSLASSVKDFPEQMTAVLEKKFANMQEYYPNKPHMLAEFGYPCVYGFRGDPEDGPTSEDFAGTFLRVKCKELLKNPQIKGLVLWCWADYRHRRGFVPSKSAMSIQATYGPYGILTMDRKIKQPPYDAIREAYAAWQLPTE